VAYGRKPSRCSVTTKCRWSRCRSADGRVTEVPVDDAVNGAGAQRTATALRDRAAVGGKPEMTTSGQKADVRRIGIACLDVVGRQ
jgi:hypothetical protein